MTNPPNTGRGGARPGSGRRSGSKAPPSKVVRLPVDLAEAARQAAAARGGNASGIGAFLRGEARTDATAPLMSSTVACGFPSPAEDHLERPLDLNELHGIGTPSVFLVRVQGESMRDAGMLPGDVVIVDKSREVQSGNVVVACLNGDFTLKRFIRKRGRIVLHPENPAFPDIEVPEAADFQVWGVVTGLSRKL